MLSPDDSRTASPLLDVADLADLLDDTANLRQTSLYFIVNHLATYLDSRARQKRHEAYGLNAEGSTLLAGTLYAYAKGYEDALHELLRLVREYRR